MKTQPLLHRGWVALSIATVLILPCARAADALSSEEVQRLLKEIPVAHEGMILAIATYRISYGIKGEPLEDCKTYAEAMRNRSEHLRGPVQLPKAGGRRIIAEEWIPREFSCELIGNPDAHKLTYQCLLKNSYDNLPVGVVCTQLRNGDECLEYYPQRQQGSKESTSYRLAPSYLALLHHLPTDIPYLQKPGSWGTGKESSIADLFNKAVADPAHYEVTASKQDSVIRMNILQSFAPDRTSTPGAEVMWTVELDAAKNFAPLLMKRRPGRRIDGAFKEYGYGDSMTCSGYQEPSPGIWMPAQITAENEERLNAFVKPEEDTTAWNKTNASLEATMRIARFTVKVTKIELNGPVNDDELVRPPQG